MVSIDFPVTSKDSANLDSKTATHMLRTGLYNEGTDQPIDPVQSTPTFCCKLGGVIFTGTKCHSQEDALSNIDFDHEAFFSEDKSATVMDMEVPRSS